MLIRNWICVYVCVGGGRGQLLCRFKVWARRLFGGCLGYCDGLIGHHIEGRHDRRGAPRVLPAQWLGEGWEGEGQAEVGARQVPVFAGAVSVPLWPHEAAGTPPLYAAAGLGVGGRRVSGQGKHARHVEVHLWREG